MRYERNFARNEPLTTKTRNYSLMQQFFEMWADVATKMATAGMSVSPDVPPPEAARQVRTAVFETMAQYADRFMRSPQFLEFARTSLDADLGAREGFNDLLTKLRHELQGVARQDVESVLAGVHQMERRVMDRLDEIDKRLDELKSRLGDSTKGQGTGKSPSTRR